MEEIILYTADGIEEVTTLSIPVFDPRFDIIQWGARFFAWRQEHEKYCEVMVYTYPPDGGRN